MIATCGECEAKTRISRNGRNIDKVMFICSECETRNTVSLIRMEQRERRHAQNG